MFRIALDIRPWRGDHRFLYIPLWNTSPVLSFEGDLVVVLYLLLIPTLTFFLGGWYSRSIFSTLGAVRSITQLFAYEIPLLIALLSPALLANTWSIAGMVQYYAEHPYRWLFNLIGFGVGLITLLGKLERVPFDAPEAETEIVAGSFTDTAAGTWPSSAWPSTPKPSPPPPPGAVFCPSAWASLVGVPIYRKVAASCPCWRFCAPCSRGCAWTR
jgi:hypothetical protein